MYTIIGADERQYGPVSADQLRQWILEGRANAGTRVRLEGATEWKKLSELPEFFPETTSAAKPTPAPAPFPTTPTPRNNQLAVASLVLGILSVTLACCCYGIPFNIAGIVCSIMALAQIKDEPGKYRGKELAIAGLVLSIFSLLLAAGLLAVGTTKHWNGILRRIHRL